MGWSSKVELTFFLREREKEEVNTLNEKQYYLTTNLSKYKTKKGQEEKEKKKKKRKTKSTTNSSN